MYLYLLKSRHECQKFAKFLVFVLLSSSKKNDRPRYLGFRFQWHWLTFHVRLPSLRSSALVPPPLRLLASSGSASHALRLGIESSGGGGSCVLWQNLHGTKTTSALLCLAMAPLLPANIFQNHTFYIYGELKILI